MKNVRRPPQRLVALSVLVGAALLGSPASSLDISKGDFQGSFDTTLSYGAAWRVEERDKSLYSTSEGGTAFSGNYDDGDLNYDKGFISNSLKATLELELGYKRFGAFFRGFAFYDYENEKGERARTPLSEDALDRVGSRAELRDAFIRFGFDIGSRAAELRLGQQVVSWGESTFIQNGINVINPIDVSAFRIPGSELRDALLPVGMLWGTLETSTETSLELFYQYEWEEVFIDPNGGYWSTVDYAGPGARRVVLGFGLLPDDIDPSSQNVVRRGPDRKPKDGGQYGLAFRWYAEALNDTELGLYYIHFHSRLPILSGHTGTEAANLAGRYVEDAYYFEEYPEDLDLYGVSFSTVLGPTGVALQGELSYHPDNPLQVDDVELLAAALTPALPALGGLVQLGPQGFDQDISGAVVRDTMQFQTTATKVLGPTLGADEALLIGEVGVTHVLDMPSTDELRLESQGTYTSGNELLTQIGLQPATEDAKYFPDATSWGYRLAGRFVYNNAIGPVGLTPVFAWQHDVTGTAPGPGGNFIEGRMAATVGLDASFQQQWGAELRYTNFLGGGSHNLLIDRDFVSLNLKYSF